jgi:RNA polymerase sigma-70 factor (ECF subfamily)
MSNSPDSNPSQHLTTMLESWRAGDVDALDRVTRALYPQIQAMARRQSQSEREGHTLQGDALISEVFLKLLESPRKFENRAHFLATVAVMMRRVLVDYARSRNTAKRGQRATHVELDDKVALAERPLADLIALDEALERLASWDVRKAKLIEMAYFGGYNQPEMAEALDVSLATVERELRLAKRWLNQLLTEKEG